jgi:hypothetical protein
MLLEEISLYSFIFTGIVAISTIFYSLLTWGLLKESKKSREFNETPFIVASIDYTTIDKKIIILKIKNIGLGFAQNIHFKVIKDYEWSKDKPLKNRGAVKNGIMSFPPNYELNYHIASLYGDNKPITDEDYIELEIFYENIHKKKYFNSYKLTFNEIIGQGYSRPPSEFQPALIFYLAEINKKLEKEP